MSVIESNKRYLVGVVLISHMLFFFFCAHCTRKTPTTSCLEEIVLWLLKLCSSTQIVRRFFFSIFQRCWCRCHVIQLILIMAIARTARSMVIPQAPDIHWLRIMFIIHISCQQRAHPSCIPRSNCHKFCVRVFFRFVRVCALLTSFVKSEVHLPGKISSLDGIVRMLDSVARFTPLSVACVTVDRPIPHFSAFIEISKFSVSSIRITLNLSDKHQRWRHIQLHATLTSHSNNAMRMKNNPLREMKTKSRKKTTLRSFCIRRDFVFAAAAVAAAEASRTFSRFTLSTFSNFI